MKRIAKCPRCTPFPEISCSPFPADEQSRRTRPVSWAAAKAVENRTGAGFQVVTEPEWPISVTYDAGVGVVWWGSALVLGAFGMQAVFASRSLAPVAFGLLFAAFIPAVIAWHSRQIIHVATDGPVASSICLRNRWRKLVLPVTEVRSISLSSSATPTLSSRGMQSAPSPGHAAAVASFHLVRGRSLRMPIDGVGALDDIILSLQRGNPDLVVIT